MSTESAATEGPEQEALYQAICVATEQVFTTMLNLEPTSGEPVFEHDIPEHFDGVVSFVGLAGARVGTGSFRCSAICARRLASTFLLTDFPSVDEQVLDVIGELTNMIVGNAKGVIEQLVGPLVLTTPTSVLGHDLTAHAMRTHKWTVVPFRCGNDRFDIMIHLMPGPPAESDDEVRRRMLRAYTGGDPWTSRRLSKSF